MHKLKNECTLICDVLFGLQSERCSFSVQMWHLHMSGLQHDLWDICPPSVAQSIFIAVLKDSLLVMAMRYADACPTYRRLPQFRFASCFLVLNCVVTLGKYCESI